MDSYIQYTVFGSVAIVTNCFVIFVLLRNPKLLKSSAFVFGLSLGDVLDGLAMLIIGTFRIKYTLNGTISTPVHPTYCMTIFMTPLFILGNQIPGFMFFVIGIERFLAVRFFDWYHARWSNKLAWLMTAAVYSCSFISLFAAYGVVFFVNINGTSTLSCGTNTVLGTGYGVYNYSVAIVGGTVAFVATVGAIISFTKRERQLKATTSNLIKTHVKKQWHTSRVMLCLAMFDLILVVIPNLLVTLTNVPALNKIMTAALNNILSWSLQIVSLRSSLNVFIYLAVNRDFRQAAFKAVRLQKQVSIVPAIT